jgi:hypothetical protein
VNQQAKSIEADLVLPASSMLFMILRLVIVAFSG